MAINKLFHYTYENRIPVAETRVDINNDYPGIALIHNRVWKFNKTIFRDMLVEFELIKAILKNDFNIHKIMSLDHSRGTRFAKYCEMFGFTVKDRISNGDRKYTLIEMEL